MSGAIHSSAWTGRGPEFTGRTLADSFPECAEMVRFAMAMEMHQLAIAMEAHTGTDPKGLDGEAATARAEGIAHTTPSSGTQS